MITKNIAASQKETKNIHTLISPFLMEFKRKRANLKSDAQTAVKKTTLLNEIKDVQLQIESVRSCFNMTTDFDLTDSYIMQLYSLEKRHSYLLKIAKTRGLSAF